MLSCLRRSPWIARCVLVWFALALGAAVASPLVNPQATQLVCSNGGMKIVIPDDDAPDATKGLGASHSLDCPMCFSVAAPPPLQALTAEPPHPLSYALQALPAARLAALVGAPLPARGPPSPF